MVRIESHSAAQYLSALKTLGGSLEEKVRTTSGRLPDSLGTGQMEHFQLGSGLELSITRYEMVRALQTEVNIDRPTFSFGCVLDGHSQLEPRAGMNRTANVRAGHSLSIWSSCDGFRFNVPAKTKLCSVVVSVTAEFLKDRCWGSGSRLMPQLERAISSSAFPQAYEIRQLSPVALAAARQVLESRDSDPLRSFLIESHALTLLREQILTLSSTSPQTAKRRILRNNELERLHEVRRLLLTYPERSPSIRELAHHVGMNDCDLKRGFRSAYGTTMYEFLRRRRMELANQLLANRQRSIAQVAEAVGYRSPSRFAVAFRQHFGVSPKRRQTN